MAVDFNAAIDADKTIYAHWTAPTSYYKLTATASSSRFVLRYKGDSGLNINPEKGDVIAFKYRSNKPVNDLILRNASGSSSTKFAYYDDIIDWSTGPDEDGWYSFYFEYDTYNDGSAASYPVSGFRLEMFTDGSTFAVDDYIEILGFSFNGEAIEISGTDTSKGVYENVYPTVTVIDL